MGKTKFRIVSILLDGDENVASVTALTSPEAVKAITEMGGDLRFRGMEGNQSVTLPLATMRKLHAATGKIRGDDPRQEVTSEIYDSLCMVIYGLIED